MANELIGWRFVITYNHLMWWQINSSSPSDGFMRLGHQWFGRFGKAFCKMWDILSWGWWVKYDRDKTNIGFKELKSKLKWHVHVGHEHVVFHHGLELSYCTPLLSLPAHPNTFTDIIYFCTQPPPPSLTHPSRVHIFVIYFCTQPSPLPTTPNTSI